MQWSLFRQLRGEQFIPAMVMTHAVHVTSSLRGIGLLASPLGPLSCRDVCQALCRPLAPDDWHHRLITTWVEQTQDSGPGHNFVRTGRTGDLRDVDELEAHAHQHAPARNPRQPSKRPGQYIATHMWFTDLLPHAGVRGHVTMTECAEGREERVFNRYFTPAVQAQMRRRGQWYASMCERRLSQDLVAFPALPIAVLLS